MKGIFIVLEGIDGSGKSTQLEVIKNFIKTEYPGQNIIVTREPGGFNNPVGEQLREVILNNEMDDYTRALLYAASRYEHQLQIKKWIDMGYIVICDRYIYSSLAYQARTSEEVYEVLNINRYNKIALPDYVIHFDVNFETYLQRKSKRTKERDLDALERKSNDFFKENIKMYDAIYNFLEEITLTEFIKVNANKALDEVSFNTCLEIKEIIERRNQNRGGI